MSKLPYLDVNTLTQEKVDYYNRLLKINQTVEEMRPDTKKEMIKWVLNKL
jgi:hypothetical protein